MYRLNEFHEDDPVEDDDGYEFRKSQAYREKWFILLCLLIVFAVVCYVQDKYLEDYDRDGKYLDARARRRYEDKLKAEEKHVKDRIMLDYNPWLKVPEGGS